MRTEIFLRRSRRGYFKISPKKTNICYWAEWRIPTVFLWSKIVGKEDNKERPSSVVMEERAWRYLLKRTSLVKMRGVLFEETPEDVYQNIMKFPLSFVPHHLVVPVMQSVHLSNEEETQIKWECYSLWSGTAGTSLHDPHPLLEEAVEIMEFKERYGIGRYHNLGDMPQKTKNALRLISSAYNEMQERNQLRNTLQERAAQIAGIKRPTQELNEHVNPFGRNQVQSGAIAEDMR